MSIIEWTELLGNVGEFLGSLAVFATLIYLAVQVRHSRDLLEDNRKLAMSEVFQTRSNAKMALHFQEGVEPLTSALPKFLEIDPEELVSAKEVLSTTEFQAVRAWQLAWATHTDNIAYQTELGLMDPATIKIAANAFSSAMPMVRTLDVPLTPRLVKFIEEHADDV